MSKVTRNDGKGKYVFCGIDLHEEKMMVGTAVDRGELRYRELGTDDRGVELLLAALEKLAGSSAGSEVWVAYEAGGCWFWLADLIDEAGYKAVVLAPTHLPSSPHYRSRKTDKRDAERIVEVLRGHCLAGNHLPSVWIPSAQVRDDREVVRCRLDLTRKLTRVKNEVSGLLRRYRLKRPASVKTPWSKRHVEWLRGVAAELEWGAAQHLLSLLREYDFLAAESRRLEGELIRLSESEGYSKPAAALTELCGVGQLTAMVFLTELGDLGRFRNRRALGNYLGLTPRSWESGAAEDRKGHISKQGPSRIRGVLSQAAWARVTHDPASRSWFKRKVAGKKDRRKKVITAQMRQLGILMWHTALEAA